MCGVEESPVLQRTVKLHEILRLRETPLSLRFAPLRMTWLNKFESLRCFRHCLDAKFPRGVVHEVAHRFGIERGT